MFRFFDRDFAVGCKLNYISTKMINIIYLPLLNSDYRELYCIVVIYVSFTHVSYFRVALLVLYCHRCAQRQNARSNKQRAGRDSWKPR